MIVCQKMFTSTLGMAPNSANSIHRARKRIGKNGQKEDQLQGKHKRNYDKFEAVKADIMSRNPQNHYRRKNAPNKRYLPGHLSVLALYNNYCLKYPSGHHLHVTYNFYRTVLKKRLNISLKSDGNEKCSECRIQTRHKEKYQKKGEDCKDGEGICIQCATYEKHHQKYVKARQTYKQDVELSKENPNVVVFCTDMKRIDTVPGKIILRFSLLKGFHTVH